MLTRALRLADRVSDAALAAAMALAVALIGVMLVEVFARYVLGRPTVWSYDVTGMLNGCMFLFAAAPALRRGAHVAVDVLSRRLPARVAQGAMALVLALLLMPVMLWVEASVVTRAWRALLSGEVAEVSPWRHVLWPYYAGIALALLTFLLQVAAEAARSARAALSSAAPALG